MPTIRIIATPPGEAPEAIRQAWIGVEIALAGDTVGRWRPLSPSQAMTGPRVVMNAVLGLVRRKTRKWESYTVEAMEAFDALRVHDPEAHEWWRINAPHLMRPGRKIEFPATVCTEMATAVRRE